MSSKTKTELAPPFREITTLKENKYKKVTLMEDDKQTRFIAKAFRGHEEKFSRLNAQYAFDTLALFHRQFENKTVTPMPLGVDLDLQQVYLEYLPNLPSAELLDSNSLHFASPFFEQCYRIIDNQGFIRSIGDSIYFSKRMESWLGQSKPVSLGLKGDLWQNLCVSDSILLLADIDSAALEPLGLSEVVMHAEIHAELSLKNLWHKLAKVRRKPICFDHLSASDAQVLVEMALEFVGTRMHHLSAFVRTRKLRAAETALLATIHH